MFRLNAGTFTAKHEKLLFTCVNEEATVANDLCIKAKARCGSVEQSGFSDLLCSGLHIILRVQWLSGSVLDPRPRGRGFEPKSLHCVVSLSKTYNPSLELVQSRETCPYITKRLVMGHKESNQLTPL